MVKCHSHARPARGGLSLSLSLSLFLPLSLSLPLPLSLPLSLLLSLCHSLCLSLQVEEIEGLIAAFSGDDTVGLCSVFQVFSWAAFDCSKDPQKCYDSWPPYEVMRAMSFLQPVLGSRGLIAYPPRTIYTHMYIICNNDHLYVPGRMLMQISMCISHI